MGLFQKAMARWKRSQDVRRFKAHYSKAVGSELEKLLIAAAMGELESPHIAAEMRRIKADQREAFMMAYECFVMWCLTSSLGQYGGQKATDAAVLAMRNHFAKHAWYVRGAFEKVWAEMQKLMPDALKPKGSLGIVYPATEIGLAAQFAGLKIDHVFGLSYDEGVQVIFTMNRLIDFSQESARRHFRSTGIGASN